MYTFNLNKFYAYLINVELNNLVYFKTYSNEFVGIIIIFIDQDGRPLEIKDKVNLKLLINR